MNHLRSILAAALVATPLLTPSATLAQGFEGAELSAGFSTLTADRSFGVASYAGGIQFGLFSGISVAVDVAAHDWRGFTGRSNTVTLHGIYEFWQGTSAGAFIGQERLTAGKATTYGIEGTTQFAGVEVAGYLGGYDAEAVSGTMAGLDASYPFGTAFALTGGVSTLTGNTDFNRVSLGGEYRFAGGPVVFAAVERESSGDLSDTYLTLGAKVELGNGTTFGSRGLSDNQPVF